MKGENAELEGITEIRIEHNKAFLVVKNSLAKKNEGNRINEENIALINFIKI